MEGVMSTGNTSSILPDHLVAPGDVLADYLDVLHMTQVELSARTGLAKKTINEIIKGKAAITAETALKLERALGRPAHFWNDLERQYQQDRVRLIEYERLQQHLPWLATLPVRSMIKLGWIEACKDKTGQLEEVLRFYGIASPELWEEVWSVHQVNPEQATRLESNAASVSAWLRQGELLSRSIGCAHFNAAQFRACLFQLRALTGEAPGVFLPRLIDLCRTAGVAVVVVPELPKLGVYGATRWMDGKALIQLSQRFKSNDDFWWTFFHLAGHILLHGRKEVFIESAGCEGEKETEADRFASDVLMPPNDYADFIATKMPTLSDIEQFASEIGIAPGIVVGCLQRDELLQKNRGNGLKVLYDWSKT
jgi:addiction module HigA family antidote